MNAERTPKDFQRLLAIGCICSFFNRYSVCVFCWQHGDWPQGLTSRMSNRSPERLLSKKIKQAQTRRCRQCNRVNCCVILLAKSLPSLTNPAGETFHVLESCRQFAVFCAQQFFHFRLSEWWAFCREEVFFSQHRCNPMFCALQYFSSRNSNCSFTRRTRLHFDKWNIEVMKTCTMNCRRPSSFTFYLHLLNFKGCCRSATNCTDTYIFNAAGASAENFGSENLLFPPLSCSLLLLWTRLYVLGRLCSPWLWRWSALWQLASQYETHGW